MQAMNDANLAVQAKRAIEGWRHKVSQADTTRGGTMERPAVTDSQGYYIAAVLHHPSVRAALADPIGARVALMSYGELVGFPVGGLSPIYTHPGRESWQANLENATPLSLGIAWLKIEEREADRRARKEQRPTQLESAQPHEKEKDTMPVIQPTKSLDVGIYPAIITAIDEVETTFQGDTVPTQQLRYQFVILDGDEETDDEIRGFTSRKFGAKTTMYKWAKAILGAKRVQPDQPFDSDRLLRKKCDIAVEMNKTGTNTRIAEVYPYKTASVQAQGQDDDDDRDPEADVPAAFQKPAYAKPERAF